MTIVEQLDFAVIVPMANEANEFTEFTTCLREVLLGFPKGRVYFIVDNASKDNTLELCRQFSLQNKQFLTICAPENRNVVDAYLRGYRAAFEQKHAYIIEMDAGLSHDPRSLPSFLKAFTEGYECVFGSRFMAGGQMTDAPWQRVFLSKGGTFLTNMLLGTHFKDMTSGFQGFSRSVVEAFLKKPLLSKAHFYQTELRYLLRKRHWTELPIHYKAPSPSVSRKAIVNSFAVLNHYFFNRLKGQTENR